MNQSAIVLLQSYIRFLNGWRFRRGGLCSA